MPELSLFLYLSHTHAPNTQEKKKPKFGLFTCNFGSTTLWNFGAEYCLLLKFICYAVNVLIFSVACAMTSLLQSIMICGSCPGCPYNNEALVKVIILVLSSML